MLSSTTPYYKVLLQYYSVLQSTMPVLLCSRKYYASTTKYYSVLQGTTPVLLCTTTILRTTIKVLRQYYSVLLLDSSTTPSTPVLVQYYSVLQSPTAVLLQYYSVLQSTTKYYASTTNYKVLLQYYTPYYKVLRHDYSSTLRNTKY